MIELTVDKFEKGKVVFHISRQDEEDYKRLEEEITFKISGINYFISTGYFPGFYPNIRTFYVRGNLKEKDFKRIRVEFSEYLIIYELVKKYNENFFQKVI